MTFILNPGTLTLNNIEQLLESNIELRLDPSAHNNIHAAEKVVQDILADNKVVYGINTGFGLLANTHIKASELETLQRSIVLSHAAGVGDLLDNKIVKLILLLKINSLARGFSGVRLTTIERLITFYNKGIYPSIPCQGSVGASGDLAPLAHLSAALIGVGTVSYQDQILSAEQALHSLDLAPLTLAAKEGLALLNGTQVSTALAIIALLASHKILGAALTAGALTLDATLGSVTPFDARIHAVRGLKEQIHVAQVLRTLLKNSAINASHQDCEKVQDPYSLRCQPQVMGACLAHLRFAEKTLVIEANAVSDNPLVFANEGEILSGGNFHAEPVAMAADTMALSIAEIGALSERRIALLTDPRFSSLPAFLVSEPGINSGFMIAQVTAAALASENKCLAHPASVDSLPTSANQEDHVSMATYAARRLLAMAENTANIVAIEMLAACQGIDFRRPLKSSDRLEKIHAEVRTRVAFYEKDRFFAPDIAAIKTMILEKNWSDITQLDDVTF